MNVRVINCNAEAHISSPNPALTLTLIGLVCYFPPSIHGPSPHDHDSHMTLALTQAHHTHTSGAEH